MIIEILLALLLGILAGTFTGIAPGIHINLVALLLFVNSELLLSITSPIVVACFIVSMAIVHTFIDFIPSIFLGCPEESTALSILPGHKLLLKGKGYEAIMLTTFGCYIGIILLFLLVPLFIIFLPNIYETLNFLIPFVLIAASIFLIIKEKNPFLALTIFLFAGILGILTLNFYLIKEPLFPLLTGLFGISTILTSINQKTKLPEQKIIFEKFDKKEVFKILPSSVISSSLCAFLPGLGSSQAAVLGSQMKKTEDERAFLFLLGSISTLVLGLNFAALYIIGKARSGTGIIIQKFLEEITLTHLSLLLIIMLISGSIAVFLSIFFVKIFIKYVSKIDYTKMNFVILIILIIMSVLISGWFSLFVLIISTALGIIAINSGVKRMHLMGCLIVPVILYFLL
ncbi:MAG: tripartite tricarboxylate transporter permease [Candidatus Pacearchaeota archaeon]